MNIFTFAISYSRQGRLVQESLKSHFFVGCDGCGLDLFACFCFFEVLHLVVNYMLIVFIMWSPQLLEMSREKGISKGKDLK